jgi:hypothetical protein
MIFDKNAEKFTTPQVKEEPLQVNDDHTPRKMTAIEKKLRKFDDRLQRNLEDYTNDAISNVVFNLRREKILRAKSLK